MIAAAAAGLFDPSKRFVRGVEKRPNGPTDGLFGVEEEVAGFYGRGPISSSTFPTAKNTPLCWLLLLLLSFFLSFFLLRGEKQKERKKERRGGRRRPTKVGNPI